MKSKMLQITSLENIYIPWNSMIFTHVKQTQKDQGNCFHSFLQLYFFILTALHWIDSANTAWTGVSPSQHKFIKRQKRIYTNDPYRMRYHSLMSEKQRRTVVHGFIWLWIDDTACKYTQEPVSFSGGRWHWNEIRVSQFWGDPWYCRKQRPVQL